jgi:GTP:adenosylcobinamide-phosphate guanylyltransferase
MTVAALVLAGTRAGADDPMAKAAGVSHKAIMPVAGVPMLARVLAALAATPEVSRIAVAIERPDLVEALPELAEWRKLKPVEILPAASGPSESVADGLARLGAPLLITTADHALLRPEWVSWFLAHVPPGADVAAAVARDDVVQAAAPGTKRTYLRFSDAAVSGCNLFLMATPRAEGVVRLWETVQAYRKKPVRLAWLLGPVALLKFVMGRLTLGEAAARLGKLADAKASVILLPFGRAAVDVDKPADLELVEKLLAEDALL